MALRQATLTVNVSQSNQFITVKRYAAIYARHPGTLAGLATALLVAIVGAFTSLTTQTMMFTVIFGDVGYRFAVYWPPSMPLVADSDSHGATRQPPLYVTDNDDQLAAF